MAACAIDIKSINDESNKKMNMEIHSLQVVALNMGAFVTGTMVGSKMYKNNKIMFFGNVFFNLWNMISLLSRHPAIPPCSR